MDLALFLSIYSLYDIYESTKKKNLAKTKQTIYTTTSQWSSTINLKYRSKCFGTRVVVGIARGVWSEESGG